MSQVKTALSLGFVFLPFMYAPVASANHTSYVAFGSTSEQSFYNEVTKTEIDYDYYYHPGMSYPQQIFYQLSSYTTDTSGNQHNAYVGIVEDYLGDPRDPKPCGPSDPQAPGGGNQVYRCGSENVTHSLFVATLRPGIEGFRYYKKQQFEYRTPDSRFELIFYNPDQNGTGWTASVVVNPTETSAQYFELAKNIEMYKNFCFGAFASIATTGYMNTTGISHSNDNLELERFVDLRTYQGGTIKRVLNANMVMLSDLLANAGANNQYLYVKPGWSAVEMEAKFYGQPVN